MKNEHTVEELVIKYLAGEASRDEAKELLDWVALSKENEAFYLQHKKIFDASFQKRQQALSIDIDQEWNNFLNKVQHVPEAPVIPLEPVRPVWMKLAAALLVLAVSGFIITWLVSRNHPVIYHTDAESLALVLPDGSHITLNDHSSLSYSPDFGTETRTVELTGEAFFDVAHDPKHPFIIGANPTKVEVVGTSFDVRSYGNENRVDVTVVTGVVKFSTPDGQQELKLTAGQKGSFTKGAKALERNSNTDPNFDAWNTQKLVFTERDLTAVIETLNKTYHTHMVLSTDIPPSCIVTVSFDHQTLDAVLHVLETTLNLTIQKTGNKIEITHAGC